MTVTWLYRDGPSISAAMARGLTVPRMGLATMYGLGEIVDVLRWESGLIHGPSLYASIQSTDELAR